MAAGARSLARGKKGLPWKPGPRCGAEEAAEVSHGACKDR